MLGEIRNSHIRIFLRVISFRVKKLKVIRLCKGASQHHSFDGTHKFRFDRLFFKKCLKFRIKFQIRSFVMVVFEKSHRFQKKEKKITIFFWVIIFLFGQNSSYGEASNKPFFEQNQL